MPNGTTNGTLQWLKILAPFIGTLVAVGIAFGLIRGEMATARHDLEVLDRSLSRVETQASNARAQLELRVETRLVRIEEKLDRLLLRQQN
jgi:hypothetical protein